MILDLILDVTRCSITRLLQSVAAHLIVCCAPLKIFIASSHSSHCQGSKDKLGANRGRFQPKDKAGLVNFEEEQFLEVPWPNGAGPSMALVMISRGPGVALLLVVSGSL